MDPSLKTMICNSIPRFAETLSLVFNDSDLCLYHSHSLSLNTIVLRYRSSPEQTHQITVGRSSQTQRKKIGGNKIHCRIYG